MNNIQKLIPSIRFPEFKDLGEWQTVKLGDVLEIKHGKSQAKIENDNGIYSILGTGGEIGKTNTYMHNKPTILIGRKGTINNPMYYDQPFWAIDTIFYSIIKDTTNTKFLYYIVKSVNWLKYNTGSTMPSLTSTNVHNVKISLPTLDEQEKIADHLSTLDDLIDMQIKKLETFNEHKKGLLQNLFPTDQEKIPLYRFPKFKNLEDWQTVKLGDIGVFKSGVGFPDIEQGGTVGTPFYKVSDMNNKGNEKIMINANNYVIDEQIKSKKWSVFNTNSIIFAKVGEAIFKKRMRIANNFLIDNNMGAFVTTSHIMFMKEIFNNIDFIKYVQVGALPSLKMADLKNIKIKIPTIEEQEKITNCLFSLDELINSQTNKIANLKQYKNGLLQKLIPNNERD